MSRDIKYIGMDVHNSIADGFDGGIDVVSVNPVAD